MKVVNTNQSFVEGPVLNVISNKLSRLEAIKAYKAIIANQDKKLSREKMYRHYEINILDGSKSFTFNFAGGLCFNSGLSFLENDFLTDELRQYIKNEYFDLRNNIGLLNLLFIRYHLSRNKKLDDLDLTWPIGQVYKEGYNPNSERWVLLDFLIEELKFIVEYNELREL